MPLIFPGSDGVEADRDPNELTFRDGTRTVAPYLAVLMGGLDTERLTFDEAITAINRGLVDNHATKFADRMVADHFRDRGR